MEIDLIDGMVDMDRTILSDLKMDVLFFQLRFDRFTLFFYGSSDLDGVRSRLTLDQQGDRRFVIELGMASLFFEPLYHAAQVFDSDQRSLAIGDDPIGQFFRG